jgi:hypothetical protein
VPGRQITTLRELLELLHRSVRLRGGLERRCWRSWRVKNSVGIDENEVNNVHHGHDWLFSFKISHWCSIGAVGG